MHALIGLGNPGKAYEQTRHNIGFLVLDAYARAQGFDAFHAQEKIKSATTKKNHLRLCKPQTFMNNSGESVQKLTSYYQIDLTDILVIHDELDLALGEMKLQFGRGAAGHNGVASIISHLGTDQFWRLRIGVHGETRGQISGDTYVLSRFSGDEQKRVSDICARAVSIIRDIEEKGPEKIQQELHTKNPEEQKN